MPVSSGICARHRYRTQTGAVKPTTSINRSVSARREYTPTTPLGFSTVPRVRDLSPATMFTSTHPGHPTRIQRREPLRRPDRSPSRSTPHLPHPGTPPRPATGTSTTRPAPNRPRRRPPINRHTNTTHVSNTRSRRHRTRHRSPQECTRRCRATIVSRRIHTQDPVAQLHHI